MANFTVLSKGMLNFGLLVLAMFFIFNCHSSAILDNNTSEQKSDNLMQLIRMVGQMSGTPSSELVLDAYREYEKIHKLQSSLTDDFNETNGNQDAQSEAEKKYERVSGLLQKPELQIITQNLFNVLQEDYTYTDGPLNDNLRLKLEQAIESLFG